MVYGLIIIDKDKAIEHIKKATEIYQKEGDILSIMSSYQLMFDICIKNGLFMEEAKKYLAMKKELIEDINFDEIEDFSGKEDAYLFRDIESGSNEKIQSSLFLGSFYSHGRLEVKFWKSFIRTFPVPDFIFQSLIYVIYNRAYGTAFYYTGHFQGKMFRMKRGISGTGIRPVRVAGTHVVFEERTWICPEHIFFFKFHFKEILFFKILHRYSE